MPPTLKEVIKLVQEHEAACSMYGECSPVNKALIAESCGGSFEVVPIGSGEEKYLIPNYGSLYHLYRGQNALYTPCLPSLLRGNPSEEDIFIERMRFVVFRRMINQHPVVKHFFRRHHFLVDEEGLAQHYGLKTLTLDITCSLDIAIFFAVCWYDREQDTYRIFTDDAVHEGYLYVFRPIFGNEPIPQGREEFLTAHITPIGLQAFSRPGLQGGYALHLKRGEGVKGYLYKFTFTKYDSCHYYNQFMHKKPIWQVDDLLISKTKQIAEMRSFPYDIFNETYKDFPPIGGYSRSKMKRALSGKVQLGTKTPIVSFDDQEKKAIIEEWNDGLGEKVAQTIRHKFWYEYDKIDEKGHISGKKEEKKFRDLGLIYETQLFSLLKNPKGPSGAEWVNDTQRPAPKRRIRKGAGELKKIPPMLMEMYGKPYLTKDDWYIK